MMRAQRQLHEACYDMMASEARIATFLAIARGDLTPQSWYKLGRDHTCAYGRFLLLSWTGTMFEYLMPALWMRSYPGTMIEQTQKAAVHAQTAFTRGLRIPWGISESGSAQKNQSGDYHYFAYGSRVLRSGLRLRPAPSSHPTPLSSRSLSTPWQLCAICTACTGSDGWGHSDSMSPPTLPLPCNDRSLPGNGLRITMECRSWPS